MQGVLKELIAAVGGGAIVLVGVLTIFKKLFLKLFETGIESSFEKELEKYRNKLSRADRAFEILLNREMHYYEKIEPIFAEIVPLEHDLFECLKIDEEFEREAKCESFKVYFGKYTELTKMLKNEVLLHQAYIPKTVFEESTTFVVQMQDDFDYWFDMAKCLFAGEYGKIDYEKGEKILFVPPEPQRDGYLFGGWFKEADCINRWNFDFDTLQITDEEQEVKLYAKWIAE